MIVPFSVNDFLDRARAVYGDRIGIYDEPNQPAESLGDLTYTRVRLAHDGWVAGWLPERFGYAPSTVKHLNQTPCVR